MEWVSGNQHVDLAIPPQLVDFVVGERVLMPEPPGTYQGISLLSVSPTGTCRASQRGSYRVRPIVHRLTAS